VSKLTDRVDGFAKEAGVLSDLSKLIESNREIAYPLIGGAGGAGLGALMTKRRLRGALVGGGIGALGGVGLSRYLKPSPPAEAVDTAEHPSILRLEEERSQRAEELSSLLSEIDEIRRIGTISASDQDVLIRERIGNFMKEPRSWALGPFTGPLRIPRSERASRILKQRDTFNNIIKGLDQARKLTNKADLERRHSGVEYDIRRWLEP
jgi:hypothetical protein